PISRAASVLGRIEGALDIAHRWRDQHRARGAGGGGFGGCCGGGGGGGGGGGHRIGQGIERQQNLGGHAAEADIAHGFDEHRVEVHGVDEPEETLVRIERGDHGSAGDRFPGGERRRFDPPVAH